MANSKGKEPAVALVLLLGFDAEERRNVFDDDDDDDELDDCFVVAFFLLGSTTSESNADLEAAVTVVVRGRLLPVMVFVLEEAFGIGEEEKELDVALGGLPRLFRGRSRLLSRLSVGA
jgi:hypothetical protein